MVIAVHNCFFYYKGKGIYSPVLPRTVGYHAIPIIGGGYLPYPYLIIANSWEDWGDNDNCAKLKYGGSWIGMDVAAIVAAE